MKKPKTETAGIPICIECEFCDVDGDIPYCQHPVVMREYDPIAGVKSPPALDERSLAPSPDNRRLCGHLGLLFETRTPAITQS